MNTEDSLLIYGKAQPHSEELEEIILGSILMESNIISKVIQILSEDSFYNTTHRTIYNTIVQMFRTEKPIEMITIVAELKRNGVLENIGGASFILSLSDRVGSTANIEYHCLIVEQFAIKRRMIQMCYETIEKCHNEDDALEVFNDLSKKINTSVQKVISQKNITPQYRASETIKKLNLALQNKGITGVPSGLSGLDEKMGGWHNGNLILVGGRPGMGKTAFVLKVAHEAGHRGYPVAFFEIEMSETEVGARELSMATGVPYSNIRMGRVNQDDVAKIVRAEKEIENSNVYIDTAPLNITTLRAKAYKMIEDYKCKLIIIDFLNLMELHIAKGQSKEQAISDLSRDLKILSRTLDIPIILLCQLNREVEKSTDKRPELHHLKDSGALEQNADVVLFLYRPDYYQENPLDESGNSLRNTIIIDVAKQKQGATGETKFYCQIECNIIKDLPTYQGENRTNYATPF